MTSRRVDDAFDMSMCDVVTLLKEFFDSDRGAEHPSVVPAAAIVGAVSKFYCII